MPKAGLFASARANLTVTYQASTTDLTDQTTYTFTAQPIGAAAADRRVVVGFSWGASSGLTFVAATIGGVAATLDGDSGALTGNRRVIMISAIVPTGTTATVSVTLSGTAGRVGFGLGIVNGDPTGQVASSDATSDTLTVTTTAGQAVIACGLGTAASSAVTFTFGSGLDTLWYATLSASDSGQYLYHSMGHSIATGASTAISYTTANTSQRGALAVAYA